MHYTPELLKSQLISQLVIKLLHFVADKIVFVVSDSLPITKQ